MTDEIRRAWLNCLRAFSIFGGVTYLDCGNCARQKRCPDKEKHPKKCVKFVRLEDTKGFRAIDRTMRNNKGVWIGAG